MSIPKIRLLKARALAFKNTLAQASAKERDGHAGKGLAENFNAIVKAIGEEYPDLEDSLPKPITSSGPFARHGLSDASYLDIQVLADQVLALLDIMEEE
jgi:hypothetical protein